MRRFRSEGWDIVCLDPEFDTGTAAGRLVAHVFASIGEWELDNTVERLQDARRAKAEQGLYVGGKVPFGYRVEDDRVVEDPDAQETITRLIVLRREGRTWKQVAEALGGRLHPNGVKKIYRRETGESGGRVHRALKETT
jgi:DNA invertase Pin-like site-specific DNA recombinase